MGKLVVRFSSSQPWVYHFEASFGNGKPVPEGALPDFGEYISEVLWDWSACGADDPPDADIEY